ncbi:MAG: hypothetical protein JXB45_10360 [Candidatus Krumholzibacteriota bacterium]|nr:hypothetical protein [Candidatus Krumholzibacteriota bacterium]
MLRLRQPDRRRFKSSIREKGRRQREQLYSLVSILVVKITLLVFLCILFSVSVRLFHYRFPESSFPLRYSVPLLVAVFILVLAKYIYKNIKEIKEISKNKL